MGEAPDERDGGWRPRRIVRRGDRTNQSRDRHGGEGTGAHENPTWPVRTDRDTALGKVNRLPTESVDPTTPGAAWWEYRRAGGSKPSTPDPVSAHSDDPKPSHASGMAHHSASDSTIVEPEHESLGAQNAGGDASLAMPLAGAAALLVVLHLAARFGLPQLGWFLVPAIALVLGIAASRALAKRHPEEPFLAKFLIWGVVAKLAFAGIRFWVITVGYDGGGDSSSYHEYGRRFAEAWLHGADYPDVDNLRQTNFVRWFTGLVYYVVGSEMLVGFMVFGLFGLVGSYLWYRASADAIPFLNRRLYLALVLFVPSILFWPASLGKESLMQLGIGSMALAASLLLRGNLAKSVLAGFAGGWLLWAVRPHLLAMVALAATAAYVLGKRAGQRREGVSLTRPIGLVAIVFLLVFAAGEGAEQLGLEELSISAIEDELDETTRQTSQGGSQFDSGDNSLSPLSLPMGTVTVLMRPFPWEVESPFQILASIESAAIAFFIVYRFRSLGLSLKEMRNTPFLLFCWTLTVVYAALFSSFANFGLLVRQRSLILSALFVLLSLEPSLLRRSTTGPGQLPPADVSASKEAGVGS